MMISLSHELVLTSVPPALVNRIKVTFSMVNPEWIENERMGRYQWQTEQVLRFYRYTADGWHLPRGAMGLLIYFCRELGVSYQIDDQRRSLEPVPFTFAGELRGYQHRAVNEVLSRDFGVLEAPTGSGKTTMALAVISERKQPTLIIVHSKELLNQWRDRIQQFLGIPGKEIGQIGGGKFQIGKQVTVGIINSIYPVARDIRQHFGMIVVDECHRCPSRTFSEAVSAFDSRFMLGLSATPYRRDGLSSLIGWHLGRTVKIAASELSCQDIIKKVQVRARHTAFTSWRDTRNEYSTVLSELSANNRRNRLIIRDLSREAENPGVCLVLSDRAEHLHELSFLAHCAGIDDRAVLTGQTSKREREAIVSRLAAGQIKVLFATGQLIGEGFDARSLGVLFLATPIKFSGRLIQYLGRILRPAPGKESATIYDYVDSHIPVFEASFVSRQKVYANHFKQ